jgi:hypothetical protein
MLSVFKQAGTLTSRESQKSDAIDMGTTSASVSGETGGIDIFMMILRSVWAVRIREELSFNLKRSIPEIDQKCDSLDAFPISSRWFYEKCRQICCHEWLHRAILSR